MAQLFRETRVVSWENVRWDGGTRLVESVGRANVEIVIDLDALFATVGKRAARAKGKKSVMGGGTIIARRK